MVCKYGNEYKNLYNKTKIDLNSIKKLSISLNDSRFYITHISLSYIISNINYHKKYRNHILND